MQVAKIVTSERSKTMEKPRPTLLRRFNEKAVS